MLGKDRIRGVDIITGTVSFLFGGWILYESFKMPLRVSYAGVNNAWYISPALFPIIIGVGIALLSIIVVIHAIKHDGILQLKLLLGSRKLNSEKNLRYASILVPLCSLVYLLLERIDFIQSTMFFLFFTISVFHLDDQRLMKRALISFSLIMLIYLSLAVSGFLTVMEGTYPYLIDILSLVAFILFMVRVRLLLDGSNEQRKKYRHVLIISIVAPVFLAVVFRFLLRVPLPKEGGLTDLLYLLFQMFRKG